MPSLLFVCKYFTAVVNEVTGKFVVVNEKFCEKVWSAKREYLGRILKVIKNSEPKLILN